MLKTNEHEEPLGGNIRVIVNGAHHFSTDTVLLAHFASPKKGARVAELGTGCGTIPLLLAKRGDIKEIAAVEIQTEAYDMAVRSVRLNNLSELIKVYNADLRCLKGILPFGYFDSVICNPPYKESGTGLKNPEKEKAVARHEGTATIDDIAESASHLLQFGGKFSICLRPERITDALLAMRNHGLEVKRLQMVQQRREKAPKLFLAEGRKGGKRGFTEVLPTLFIEDEQGNFSREMLNIYGDYKR